MSSQNSIAKPSREKGGRYNLIDIIRGITLISMVLYHTMWDLVFSYRVKIPWFYSDAADVWQTSIGCTFIFLSGFCFSLGRRKLRRGLTVFASGIIVTVTTLIAVPSARIIFGVLTCIGSCMLLFIPLEKLLKKCNPYTGSAVTFLLFVLTYNIRSGYFAFFGIRLINIPSIIYSNYFTAFFGFPPYYFFSGDYYPLFPWIFLFAFGYFVFRIFDERKFMSHLAVKRLPPFEWIGRHTLPIYIIHQPAIFFILMILFS